MPGTATRWCAPKDFRLHENFAEFLKAIDHLSEAVTEWETVRTSSPQFRRRMVNLGRLLMLSRGEDARRSLETAVHLESRSPEAHFELAQGTADRWTGSRG